MRGIWKDIEGYEGYYKINEYGDIYSYKRNGTLGGFLKHQEDRQIYPYVILKKDGKHKKFSVHRLVAFAFCEKKEGKDQVNHIDSDKRNCYYKNLEWVTAKENKIHSVSSGTSKGRPGESNSASKLKESEVLLIRKLRNEYKIKINTIAVLFDIHIQTVYGIVKGESWSYLKEGFNGSCK